MQCPVCSFENSVEADHCSNCSSEFGDRRSPIHDGFEAPTLVGTDLSGQATLIGEELPGPTWSSPVEPATAAQSNSLGQLTPGSLFGGRYEIIKLLGEGGMGAVYKARDREVDRLVALKVIRPEMARDEEILKRFKQELILARQITHKNVIRIFDLGQSDGVRFITMEFIDGQDLHSLMRKGQEYTAEEKVRIIHQVCRALEAAHAEGVVHRDLKPHNIMIENSGGRVIVMDFGVAHSMENLGLTMTGALLGTPAYMSPEQAKGEKIDTRSDLFSIGVIFYEFLTGKRPYESDSMLGMLMKRIQERPVAPIDVNKEIPQALSDIVMKCLVVDVAQRYQSAQEIMQDMEGWQGSPMTFRTVMPKFAAPVPEASGQAREAVATAPRKTGKWIAAAIVVLAAGVSGYFYWGKSSSKSGAPHSPVTLMIADFTNHTGDPIFDGTLEPMMKIALEGAGFINAYDRTKVRDLGLPAATGKIDEQAARQIALTQGLGVVVSGSLDRDGGGYKLTVQASQAVTGNAIGGAGESAPNKDQVMFSVTKVASAIRKALGDSTSEADQRFAMEALSASSLEAVHEYSGAMEALSNGKSDEARTRFSKAADLDPNFGLAYTGMATASRNLGQLQDAEKYIKLAFTHIDKMTERERYRTRGSFYALIGDYPQCVQEYSALIAKFSSDVAAHNNLGVCYSRLRNLPKAIEEMQRASEILTKRPVYKFNLAMYRLYAGDYQTAEREVRKLLDENPGYEKGYLTLAYAQMALGDVAQAADTYRKLERINASGASIAASGLADLAIYEGRFTEAVQLLQKGADNDVDAKRPDAAASKFVALANVQLLRGQKGPALAAVDRALANSKAVNSQFLAGRVLAEAGETIRANSVAASLNAEIQAEPQTYGKLLEAEIALKSGDAAKAIKAFTEANNTIDTWIGHFDLGRAYLEAKAFPQADSEFDRCIKRRGESMELFMDSEPTYGYFPPVYDYLGQAREGQKSSGFAESYKTYLSIREKASEDPRIAELRKRIN